MKLLLRIFLITFFAVTPLFGVPLPVQFGVVASQGAFSPIDYEPVLWLDASQITGLNDGDSITTWSDESGNSNDATQSTAANKPTYQTNEVNSKPAVRFDGSNDDFVLDNQLFTSDDFTIFTVIKGGSQNNKGIITQWASGSSGRMGLTVSDLSDNKLNLFHVTGSAYNGYSNSVVFNSTWTITATTCSNGTISHWINSSSDGSTSTTSFAPAATSTYIGSYGPVGGAWFSGDIAELIVYNKVLTSDERENVENYLNNKYSTY